MAEVWFGLGVFAILVLLGWALLRIARKAGFGWVFSLVPFLGPWVLLIGIFLTEFLMQSETIKPVDPIWGVLALFLLWALFICVLAFRSWPMLVAQPDDTTGKPK